MLRRWIFHRYTNLIKVISRTGIMKRLIPTRIRILIGRILKKTIKILTPLNSSRNFEVFGNKFWIDPKSENFHEMAFGVYEENTIKILKKILEKGMVFVDVGAHIGYFTLLASKLVGPSGRVYAFEPNPETFSFLIRNIKENGYENIVRAIPKAVSNKVKKVHLYVPNKDSGKASFYAKGSSNCKSVEVDTIVLDDFFLKEDWTKIDVVKIDVEGAEVEVLEGMKNLIKKNSGMKLIIEFNPENQIMSIGNYMKFFDTLTKIGFDTIYAIRHFLQKLNIPDDIKKLIKITETTKYINLLCIQRENNKEYFENEK